jgi:hypothetical protein
MTLDTFFELAQDFAHMGVAVHEQLEDMLEDSWDDLNPNAVRMIVKWLESVRGEAQKSGDTELFVETNDFIGEANDFLKG